MLAALRASRQTSVCVMIDDPNRTFTSLDELRSSLTDVDISSLSGDIDDLEIIEETFGIHEAEELTKFYDRNQGISDWYYQCFAEKIGLDAKKTSKESDTVAGVLGLNRCAGKLIIVKGGPISGEWMGDASVNSDTVARSIWWYKMSGNSVSDVFGEREFARFAKSLT